MFYLRLNKIKILNNRELLGKAEVQIISFITQGEKDFPDLENFFSTNDETKKGEIIKEAVKSLVASRVTTPITHVKDKHQLYFGDSGYIVYKSQEIPDDFNWLLIAVEKDTQTRNTAALIEEILTEKNIKMLVNAVSVLATVANPVSGAIIELVNFTAKSLIKVFKNKKDEEIGYFLTSFIRQLDYRNLHRDRQDVPDTTGNMYVDYTIFGYNE